MKSRVKQWFYSLSCLFYPAVCPGCGQALLMKEKTICIACKMTLPRTGFKPHDENQIEKLFWGKVPVHNAIAFIQFQKNTPIMHLLHGLKYKGNEEIGELLGKMLAAEYQNTELFKEVDFVVPVPLHPSKLRKRGYNQCHSICEGIFKISKVPVMNDALKRVRANETQTKKGRFARFKNTEHLFHVSNKEVANKNIILVDDVVTTGSTLEACVKPLIEMNCRVSVVALAAPLD